MIVPFFALASLVVLVPALAIFGGTWMMGAVSAILAAALMIVAIALPATSLTRFMRLLRPVLVLALAAPALWMLLQVIPLPVRAVVNPIWASASAALNQRLAGTITVDTGATLLALTQYCAVIGAALLSAAVTFDRQRAKNILYILVAITTLVAAQQVAQGSYDLSFFAQSGDGFAQASVISVAGIILSCAMGIDAIDRLQWASRRQRSRRSAIYALSGAVASFLICAAAILARPNAAVVIAALLGAGMLLAVLAIRRLRLGPWGTAGVAAAAAIALFGAIAAVPVTNADLAATPSAESQPASERMLSDAAPMGSGAGTFSALLPIYRDIGTTASRESPTAAAAIAIEMGPVFVGGLIILALLGAWTLFNRSLSRGQDYVYAAAGAGAMISLSIMAFVNNGVLDFCASLLVGVLCGLAFAQSLSGAAGDALSAELQSAEEAEDVHSEARSASSLFDKTWPRIALALFGLLLTAEAAWILSAERYFQDAVGSSIEQSASSTATRRDELRKAAFIAAVRGDVWAESAFAMITQPWTDPAAGLSDKNTPEPALKSLTRALHYSPHRGDVWLMLAALSSRYRPAGYDTDALLKMSYYTAPNDLKLLPLRLHVGLAADAAANDAELRDMLKRDISLVLNRRPVLRPALAAAYRSASASGKMIVENLTSELDPSYLKTMRAQYP